MKRPGQFARITGYTIDDRGLRVHLRPLGRCAVRSYPSPRHPYDSRKDYPGAPRKGWFNNDILGRWSRHQRATALGALPY